MNLAALRAHCLARPGAVAEHPFGPSALVMKVGGRIFAIIAESENPPTVSLKCDPEIARALRARYEAVKPGYHLNKRLWNTVTSGADVGDGQIRDWIDDSYDLVLDGLPQRTQMELRSRE